jgi:hypothetical protein
MIGYHLRSRLPSDECLRLLRGALSRPRDQLRPYVTAMTGRVDPPHFHFLEVRGAWNPLVPLCYGTVSKTATGSSIDGRIHLRPSTSLLLAVPLAFLLAFVPLEALGGRLEMWLGISLLVVSAAFAVLNGIVTRRLKARYLGFLASVLTASSVHK